MVQLNCFVYVTVQWSWTSLLWPAWTSSGKAKGRIHLAGTVGSRSQSVARWVDKKRILSLPFLIPNSEQTRNWIDFQISLLIMLKKMWYLVKVTVSYLLFSNRDLPFVWERLALQQTMLACMARRKKGRELSAPLSLNSLHALKIMLACLAREKRGRVNGRKKAKSSPLENWDLPTFSLPLLHTSLNACKADLVKLADDAGILQ